MKYEIMKGREGETDKPLNDSWEPFAAIAVNSSYEFNNAKSTHYQSTVYIYLKRKKV